MVRSHWIGPVVVVLAWTGLAWAQPPSAPPTGRVLMVRELNKPGQVCRVLTTWRTQGGTRAYQVRSLATGEVLTIVESAPPGNPELKGGHGPRATTTHIFHWGGR